MKKYPIDLQYIKYNTTNSKLIFNNRFCFNGFRIIGEKLESVSIMIQPESSVSFTETEMSFVEILSLHVNLSFWQFLVQPVMKILSKWQHFRVGCLWTASRVCGLCNQAYRWSSIGVQKNENSNACCLLAVVLHMLAAWGHWIEGVPCVTVSNGEPNLYAYFTYPHMYSAVKRIFPCWPQTILESL